MTPDTTPDDAQSTNDTDRLRVHRDRDGTQRTVWYRQRDDGKWEIKTWEDDEYWVFARETAREKDVTVLIFKEFCLRWNPDPSDPEDVRPTGGAVA